MSKGLNKAERLNELLRLYQQRPYSDQELADKLGVQRQTIFRDRRELERDYPIEEREHGRYYIPRGKMLSHLKVSLYEALMVYLALQRTARQATYANPHTASALSKISDTLKQPMTTRLLRAAEALQQQSAAPERVKVLENVAQGWAEQRKVRIRYQPLNYEGLTRHLIHPYLIEPSIWSDSIYIIAYSQEKDRLIPFKLERIVSAFCSSEPFTLPEHFDDQELLRHAWGIWTREEAPVTVRLKFAPGRAAARLRESTWHPLETLTETEDGGCIWEAPIAEPREMIPWIRGWGADVEVLAPEGLRQTMQSEIHRLVKRYRLPLDRNQPSHTLLWAKTGGGRYHPLLYHLIDVGECAAALWEKTFPQLQQERLAAALGVTADEAKQAFIFLAALHDLGKASPAYQTKYPPDEQALSELQAAGFSLPSLGAHPVPHGVITAQVLTELLPTSLSWDRYSAQRLAHTVGGHHGVYPFLREVQSLAEVNYKHLGGAGWREARQELFTILQKLYAPPKNLALTHDAEEQNMLLTLLAGFVTTADWLGSLETVFSFTEPLFSPAAYQQQARQKAQQALQETGWAQAWQAQGDKLPFEVVFPFRPNAMQQAVMQLTQSITHPALVILEAPTGQGKTEAALYLADAWLQTFGGRGAYIAMPTQATSNQMFGRFKDFLTRRYPNEVINLHLVHGQARWNNEMERLRLAAIGDGREDKLRAEAWFTPRKRTLLAPFGVGTVDQALTGVLQTRHHFLRLFGLAHKVVIFDEVHAYDTYMEDLFLGLLSWLRAIGASVIVLSATLPTKTRENMARAFGASLANTCETPYPRLTLVTAAQASTHALPASASRRIALDWLPREPQTVAQALAEKLAEGGCAAVVCNTVKRAQEIYQALEPFFAPDERLLFHARMPFKWRKELEERILQAFGKNAGHRPQRAVVVATQVIEQSLDLDFDWMISELAPIDLIIQRSGRLHRHPRDNRPNGLQQPELLLLQPEESQGKPDFGADAYVYEPYILWQSWRVLQEHDELALPDETDALIQAVYDPAKPADWPPHLRDNLQKAYTAMQKNFRKANFIAGRNKIPAPGKTTELVLREQKNLHDSENPALLPQARARTRLIPPSVQIVCLHQQPDGRLTLEPDGSGPSIDIQMPDQAHVKSILQYILTIHDFRLVKALAQTAAPWRQTAALRYVYPLIFQAGQCTLSEANLILHLDRELGFTIQKEDQ